MKIAFVHDDFMQEGGAEKVFELIASIWPEAPIYTSLVDWHKLPPAINRDRIRTSFLQKLGFFKRWFRAMLPLYPLAYESFDFSNFDLVLSSTTRFAKGIITKPETVHICYLHSVSRFLLNKQILTDYLADWLIFLTKPLLVWLKRWDKAASARVDYYIANSQNVQNKLKNHYGRDGQVIYPFVDLEFFKPAKVHRWSLASQRYWLVVTRLVKWKKVDIAIKASYKMGINLKIVGDGPDVGRLKMLAARQQSAGGKIEFLDRVNRETLRELYQNAQAFIVTQDEDFGIAAVEAQACGCPVVAFDAGGVKETVIDGKTGVFFGQQTPKSLTDAIRKAGKVKWRISAIRQNALRFSKEHFVEQLKEKVSEYAKTSQRS